MLDCEKINDWLNNAINIFDVLRYAFGNSLGHCNTLCLRLNKFHGSLGLLRHFIVNRNDGRMIRVAVKVDIQIFECSVGCLGIEEVDNEEKGEIEDGED